MYLSDNDIRAALREGSIEIVSENDNYPFDPGKQIRFSSIDLRIGNRFWRFKKDVEKIDILEKDTKIGDLMEHLPDLNPGEKYSLQPGEVIHVATLERLVLSTDFAGRIVPRSSIARLGISVTCSCDFINPGQDGTTALQLINHNNFPVSITPYISICQLIIVKLSSRAKEGYSDRIGDDSRYPKERDIMPSRIGLDAEIQRVLKDRGVNVEDPNVKSAFAESVEQLFRQQDRQLSKYLRDHLPQKASDQDIQAAIKKFEDKEVSLEQRLSIITWLSSGLFIGMLAWGITIIHSIVTKGQAIESIYIPATVFVFSLIYGLIARFWKK